MAKRFWDERTLMATPRKVSVAVAVGLGASPVDVTDDLVAFSFEETAQGVGESLDITVDNASGYYTTIWWIEKGDPSHRNHHYH